MQSFSDFEALLRERYPDHNRHGTEFERAAKWMFELNLAALQQFVDRNGHARVPQNHRELFEGSEVGLGTWVVIKRTQYRAGSLLPSRAAALEALPGWDWGKARGRVFNTVVHDEELHLALLIHKDRYGHPWPTEEFEIEGIRPLHELSKMQNIYRAAPHHKNRSEGSVRRAQERVEERWAALAELFPEYPKEFPQSQYFLSNSALVAGAAVDLASSDEDLRDRERQSLEVREIADQARAVVNTGNRPVAESAVALLRAVKGWSDERFSDWEARVAEEAETAARLKEVRYARSYFAVWKACHSVAPDLLQDPTKPLYQEVFEKRISSIKQPTLEQVGNALGVTRERIRQVEAHLHQNLPTHIFDVRNPDFESAVKTLNEIGPETDPSGFAEAMKLLGTTLVAEHATDEMRTARQDLPPKSMARAKQLARLMDFLAVPVDHVPQNLLGEPGAFWMGRRVGGNQRKYEAGVVAMSLGLRRIQELPTGGLDDPDSIPISVLGLSTRPKNCLLRAGIETVGELMELSDDQLLMIQSMGAHSAREVRRRLDELQGRNPDESGISNGEAEGTQPAASSPEGST